MIEIDVAAEPGSIAVAGDALERIAKAAGLPADASARLRRGFEDSLACSLPGGGDLRVTVEPGPGVLRISIRGRAAAGQSWADAFPAGAADKVAVREDGLDVEKTLPRS